MLEVLSAVMVTAVALVVAAALIYIAGFLVTMLISMFSMPIESIIEHRHHHHPLPS